MSDTGEEWDGLVLVRPRHAYQGCLGAVTGMTANGALLVYIDGAGTMAIAPHGLEHVSMGQIESGEVRPVDSLRVRAEADAGACVGRAWVWEGPCEGKMRTVFAWGKDPQQALETLPPDLKDWAACQGRPQYMLLGDVYEFLEEGG